MYINVYLKNRLISDERSRRDHTALQQKVQLSLNELFLTVVLHIRLGNLEGTALCQIWFIYTQSHQMHKHSWTPHLTIVMKQLYYILHEVLFVWSHFCIIRRLITVYSSWSTIASALRGNLMSYGTTHFYLPPTKRAFPAFTPAEGSIYSIYS